MATETSKRDPNYVHTLMGVDMTTGLLPTKLYVDESTHRLLVNAVISGGGASDGAILDGANGTIKATVIDLVDSNPQAVAIVDGNGDQITSFGGGTQYTDAGTPPAHPVGNALLFNNGGAWAAVSAAVPLPVSGTFWQTTQPVSLASVPSHAVTNAGTFAVQATEVDGGNVTLGSKADAKSTATDTTAVTIMSVLKQISASAQAPPSQAVTNGGTFVVQATLQTQTDTVMIGGVNLKEINAVTPLMGNGVTGTGSLRVTMASDSTIPTPQDFSGTGNMTTTGNTVVATTNGCSTVSFNISGSGSGFTLVLEALINATWVAIDGDVDATDTLVSSAGTISANTLITVPCASYGSVRLRCTAIVSGTITADWRAGAGLSLVEVFNTNATSLKTTGSAEGATGSGVPANASYQGVSDGTNLRGTLGAANALNTTGAGIPTAQIIGQFDDVSPTAITENQFGNLRMSANRNLYGTIRDAAGNERGVNVTSGNALSIDNTTVAGTAVAVNTGAVSAGTTRMVQANNAGKTLATVSGTAASSGNNTLKAAGTNALKVYAFSLTTTSTTSTTCIFQSGAGGTELWRVVLQAPTSVNVGANLAVTPPAYLFATASATLLNLNLSGAQTIHYSVAYYDEA